VGVTPIAYNPFDPSEVDDHEPTLTRLRHECPVAEVMPGVFYLARHADILDVCRQPEVFHQGRFRPMDDDPRTPDQLNLGETDPPVHTRVRKALAGALSPPVVRQYEPFVRQVCRDLVDRFAGRDEADLIADLGAPLPAAVIGHVAGIPEDLRSELRAYSDDYIAIGSDPVRAAEAAAHVAAFDDRYREVIRDRRAAGDRPADLLTALVEAVDDEGRALSEEKILTHVTKDVVVGGIETTTHLVGNLFYDLLRTPGAYRRVRDGRRLVPVAVEEALRIRPPVQILFRQPDRDVTIGGVDIPAGAIVALGYASANHDEAVFAGPEAFDLDRGETVRKHLGFGYGIHLCVGAPLARLELTAALDAVLDRFPTLQLAPGFAYERVRFFMMRGPVRLLVTT
jgi:cytochrome P450